MEYSICLDGVENARELGGYKIGDKYIKKGVFLSTTKYSFFHLFNTLTIKISPL